MELARYCYLSHINLTHYRQLDEALMAIVPALLERPAQDDTPLLLTRSRDELLAGFSND